MGCSLFFSSSKDVLVRSDRSARSPTHHRKRLTTLSQSSPALTNAAAFVHSLLRVAFPSPKAANDSLIVAWGAPCSLIQLDNILEREQHEGITQVVIEERLFTRSVLATWLLYHVTGSCGYNVIWKRVLVVSLAPSGVSAALRRLPRASVRHRELKFALCLRAYNTYFPCLVSRKTTRRLRLPTRSNPRPHTKTPLRSSEERITKSNTVASATSESVLPTRQTATA
jgi:hypothetical protein